MRPRGEIREAMHKAVLELGESRDHFGGRQICAHAQVGFDAGMQTLKNMVRAGQVEIVGREKAPHSGRWVKLYAPALPAPAGDSDPKGWDSFAPLEAAIRTFAGGRGT